MTHFLAQSLDEGLFEAFDEVLGGFIGIAGEGFAHGDADVDAGVLHPPWGAALAQEIAICLDEQRPHRSAGLRGHDANATLERVHEAFLLSRAGALGENKQAVSLSQGVDGSLEHPVDGLIRDESC